VPSPKHPIQSAYHFQGTSQQLFEGIMQSAPDAMVLLNSQGQIVLANRQLERVFGCTTHGSGIPLRGLHKDGHEFPAEIALSPIATEYGKLVAASVIDVSDRQR
jgi:protein-histidine pros-kinase